jgi:ribosomal protein S18 acetylase RimI-like enzyme
VELTVRAATADDLPFLGAMLVEAAYWRPGRPRPDAAVALAEPMPALYLEDWPRDGDAGVVAESGDRPVGAAFYRRFREDRHGYGFIAADVPELTIGVAVDARGRGVGTALLLALAEAGRAEGLRGISLSVEEDNDALRLYERVGFERVELDGNAWTMRLDLTS